MLLMGKSTISMAMFHHFLYVYQRVKHAMQAADWSHNMGETLMVPGLLGSHDQP